MTLKEMKDRVFSLIEEVNPESEYLTDDVDYLEKINYVVDMINHELARVKRIAAVDKIKVKENDEVNLYEEYKDFYKLKGISGVKYELFDNIAIFKEDGEAEVRYYRYPKKIDKDTDQDKYVFENSMDVLEIMPYGIAADLLKSDVSAQYGRIYEQRYQQALNMLDVSTTEGRATIVGGINV